MSIITWYPFLIIIRIRTYIIIYSSRIYAHQKHKVVRINIIVLNFPPYSFTYKLEIMLQRFDFNFIPPSLITHFLYINIPNSFSYDPLRRLHNNQTRCRHSKYIHRCHNRLLEHLFVLFFVTVRVFVGLELEVLCARIKCCVIYLNVFR